MTCQAILKTLKRTAYYMPNGIPWPLRNQKRKHFIFRFRSSTSRRCISYYKFSIQRLLVHNYYTEPSQVTSRVQNLKATKKFDELAWHCDQHVHNEQLSFIHSFNLLVRVLRCLDRAYYYLTYSCLYLVGVSGTCSVKKVN